MSRATISRRQMIASVGLCAGASALRSAELLWGADYRIYEGAPHGICSTLKDIVNADLLSFISDGSSPDHCCKSILQGQLT